MPAVRPTPKRRLNAYDRRRVILGAATEVFARDTFAGASMDGIAASAGISKPVVYDHFGSKLALYAATLAHLRTRLITLGAAAVEARSGDRLQGMREAMEVFFSFAAEEPEACSVLITPPLGDRAARTLFEEAQRQATAEIAGILIQGSPCIAPASAKILAAFLKGGMHELAREAIARGERVGNDTIDALAELATFASASP